MTKRIVILSVAVLLIAGAALAGEKGEEKTWTGWVTDTSCGMRGDNQAEHSACAKRCASRGTALALVSSKGKLFKLDPRDMVVDNAGEYVKVKGTLKDDVITVSSITKIEKAED